MVEPRRITYVASEKLAKTSSLLPSNRNRSTFVHALITAFDLLRPSPSAASHVVSLLRPSPASESDLTAYHDRCYVDALLADPQAPTARPAMSLALKAYATDCAFFPGLKEYALGVAGASMAAARELAEGRCDVAICWDGGRHHAHKSLASGFCYVNDCVLALLVLRRASPAPSPSLDPGNLRKKSRVMRWCTGQVLSLSIHHAGRGFFPASEHAALPDISSAAFDPFALSLPLHAGASCATFARVWRTVDRVLEAFAPDYIVLQCGVDGLAEDPLGAWNWSLGGEGGLACLLLGGGGYSLPNTARAWALLTSLACGVPLSLDTPIPNHAGFTVYAPSFTLDVPPSNVRDENTEDYLTEVDAIFERVVEILQTRLAL
ncbi:hypothetical protein BJV77DRAFT_1061972 [Russula vinacea]|nr:hypothetical protein BJV77DRAFT_1061972 [Russula vinacea]